jgi:YHS domain-containing protein/mono/diheme cytochrome c family protein
MLRGLLSVSIFVLYAGCEVQSDNLPIDTSKLSEAALEGKKIFDNKNCKECHTLGKSMMTVVKQGKEVIIPDLTNPFIATDSSYVRTHLQYLEETDMPVIELNKEEIELVSRFVAELHAATHRQEFVGEPDTKCPVCQADVVSTEARKSGLWFSYLDSTYYFECEECKELFAEQPEAFRLYSE